MGETSTNVANVNMAQGLKIRVEDGCDVADPCDSNVCSDNSHCSDDWSAHSCVCDPGTSRPRARAHPRLRPGLSGALGDLFSVCPAGFFGRDCVDACQLNPCEHVSTCVRKPSSSHGYTCECGLNYYGQYCENKYARIQEQKLRPRFIHHFLS